MSDGVPCLSEVLDVVKREKKLNATFLENIPLIVSESSFLVTLSTALDLNMGKPATLDCWLGSRISFTHSATMVTDLQRRSVQGSSEISSKIKSGETCQKIRDKEPTLSCVGVFKLKFPSPPFPFLRHFAASQPA